MRMQRGGVRGGGGGGGGGERNEKEKNERNKNLFSKVPRRHNFKNSAEREIVGCIIISRVCRCL